MKGNDEKKQPSTNMDFELNWYDMETRSRKLVFELMQPTVMRSAEDREMIYGIRRQIEGLR